MNAPQTTMETLRLELPIPPLVNHYWRHITIKGAPRTLISARGRDFRENVMQIVGREKKALKIDSRVKINVRVYPPDRRKRDIDGYLKALLDSLTHAGVWLDDEYRKQETRIAQDASPASDLQDRLKSLFRYWTKRWKESAESFAREFVGSTRRRTEASMRQALKDAGFTVRMEGSRAMSEAERADVAGARYA